ncbi:MAG: 3-methyl-2-oxobutanoate hydroxymethyltransferase [Desulfobulbaceae bacterium]|nr:3-methyl-2-oxobutanoate hydroxymethyltransferase [Desulfobulbaceae bacterium]
MQVKKLTIPDITQRKLHGPPISTLTAYDYPWARLMDQAGIDVILVGDSLGMVVLGYSGTVSVTMDEMLHHSKAVARGVERALIVTDMPFGSYNCSHAEAIANANRLLKEGGADAVKLEGGTEMAKVAAAIVAAGVPVQGHVGLTPQTAGSLGGFRVQGRESRAAKKLYDDALAMEDAGCFSVVLEAIPAPLAAHITKRLSIPTIGIGAGPHCDGQVLVMHDLLGLYDRFIPKFVKQYAQLSQISLEALTAYKNEVEQGLFPAEEYSFGMKEEELDKLLKELGG